MFGLLELANGYPQAPKQLYWSLSPVTTLHEFEKITRKQHLEAILWAKVKVIVNFST